MKSLGLFLAASLAACAGGGPVGPIPKVAVPSSFREVSPSAGTTSQPVAGAEWWVVFQDPVLDSLVKLAAKNNHDVLIAASRVAEARASAGIARSALLPEIGHNTSLSHIRGGFSQGVVRVGDGYSGARSSFVSPFETSILQGGLLARWEIDLFGGLRKMNNAAKADAVAAEETRRDVLLVVTAEVARNYVEFRGIHQQLVIVEQNREAQSEMLRLTRVRAEAGLATELDVERQAAAIGVDGSGRASARNRQSKKPSPAGCPGRRGAGCATRRVGEGSTAARNTCRRSFRFTFGPSETETGHPAS